MHLDETAYQREYARRRTGGTATEHLDRLGLPGSRLTLGHGCGSPSARHRAGRRERRDDLHQSQLEPPPSQRHRAGEPLPGGGCGSALGLDEAGLNDDRDMLQEMRLALRIHRVPGMDDDVPTSAQIFRMATADGAATTPLRRAHRGALRRPGCGPRADTLALHQPSLPRGRHSGARRRPYRARSAAIDLVLVGGEVVVRDGRVTRVDKSAVLEGARRGAPPAPHARRGATDGASGGPCSPTSGSSMKGGSTRSRSTLLPAELAVVARGHPPQRIAQGEPCRKRSAQAWVASRYRRPYSTLGSISLPSCHSFQLETRIHGGSADERGPPGLVVRRSAAARSTTVPGVLIRRSSKPGEPQPG